MSGWGFLCGILLVVLFALLGANDDRGGYS